MKALLTHGYFLKEDEVEKTIMKPYPPLGLLYISAFLNKHQQPHLVFDTTFSTELKWQNFILEEKPDIIAFYVNLMTKVKVIKLMKWIKKNPELEAIKIVLGGPDITYNKANYLKAGAHFLIIGEGEETTLELIQSLSINSDLSLISGLVFQKNGKTITNAPRQKVKEIDDLPLPNRSVFHIEKYL